MFYDDITEYLQKNCLTYKWLLARMKERGFEIGEVTLSRWVHQDIISELSVQGHNLALSILTEYDNGFVQPFRKAKKEEIRKAKHEETKRKSLEYYYRKKVEKNSENSKK